MEFSGLATLKTLSTYAVLTSDVLAEMHVHQKPLHLIRTATEASVCQPILC